MKLLALLLTCLPCFAQFPYSGVVWSSQTVSQPSCLATITNISAIWHFDDTLTDATGNANNLTQLGWTALFTNGVHNHAITNTTQNNTLDVQISDNATVRAGSGVSFSYWFWFNDGGGTDANNPILAKWNNNLVDGISQEYVCAFVKPSLGLIWQCNNLANNSEPFVNTNGLVSGVWHFCVVGYDDSTQKIFMSVDNSALIQTTCVGVYGGNPAFRASLAFLNYSQDKTGISSSWKGMVDEAGLVKYAFSTAQIAALWNSGAGCFYAP